MSRANQLSVPGERAARDRVEDVFAAADRLSPDDLYLTVVPRRDRERRNLLLAELEQTAERAGRRVLLDEALERVRDGLVARAIDPLFPRAAVIGIRPSGRPEDLAEVMAAIEDAVAVAVVEDRLAPDTADVLAVDGRRLLGLPALGGSPEPAEPETEPRWAPSAQDWAAAAHGETSVTPGTPMPGIRGMWLTFLVVAGVVAAVASLAWGVLQDQLLLGVLGAIAVIAVAWTLARAGNPYEG